MTEVNGDGHAIECEKKRKNVEDIFRDITTEGDACRRYKKYVMMEFFLREAKILQQTWVQTGKYKC